MDLLMKDSDTVFPNFLNYILSFIKIIKKLINLGENPNFIFDFGSISVAQIKEKLFLKIKKTL